jgi:hypothetical protein
MIDGYQYFKGTTHLHLQGLNYLDELGRKHDDIKMGLSVTGRDGVN